MVKNREEIRGKIEFKNVCFSYNDNEVSDKIALDGLNLEIEPGKKVALVGDQDAGKVQQQV